MSKGKKSHIFAEKCRNKGFYEGEKQEKFSKTLDKSEYMWYNTNNP